MIVYNSEKKDALLFKLNPIVKIAIICMLTIIFTFDYKPYFSVYFIIIGILLFNVYGKYPIKDIVKIMKPFIALSIGLMLFVTITRGVNSNYNYDLHFLIFKWSIKDLILVSALGSRIFVITLYSAIFVVTTDPIEFTLSLIKYLKLPASIGYSLLTAYRFIPTFKSELETIQFAHEIRGGDNKKGLIGLFKSTKLFMIPLLANAVRKGERVSLAMEARAFGKYKDRTYYKDVNMSKKDINILIAFFIFFIVSIITFIKFNLIRFSLGFNL